MAMAIPNDSDRAMFLVMAFCGPRLSEAAAIQPGWLNESTGTIRLTHTWQRESGGTWHTGPLKDGERRDIPVPRGLLNRLVEIGASLPAPEIGHAPVLFRPSYDLAYSTIGVYNRWTWRDQVWEPMITATGLDYTTKDLRAFAASLLADSGATHQEIQKALGHSQASTTLRYYMRAMDLRAQDPARLAIRANQRLTYTERLDRLYAAWVRRFGDPLPKPRNRAKRARNSLLRQEEMASKPQKPTVRLGPSPKPYTAQGISRFVG
jgi:integrase